MTKGKSYSITLFLLVIFTINAYAQSGRSTIDLSDHNWSLWLDTAAKWQNDQLYAPPVDIKKICRQADGPR
jgi:hypothetical protein